MALSWFSSAYSCVRDFQVLYHTTCRLRSKSALSNFDIEASSDPSLVFGLRHVDSVSLLGLLLISDGF